jgi:hypothetical protein
VRACHPRLVALEERRVPAQFGVPWHDAQHLTLSFVPDGTLVGNQPSTLFQTLDAQQPTAQWQAEILRAFQTWAVVADINFGLKADDGAPLGVPGPDQEDPRFGDIRIASVPLDPGVLAISIPHDPFLSGTYSGDILLNSSVPFDSGVNLFPVLLHEVGHVLGFDDSTDPASALFPQLDNQRAGLSPADIAAVQGLYGPRIDDPPGGPAGGGGDTLATAAAIPAPSGFDGTTPLFLYSSLTTPGEAHAYSFTAPAGYQGPVTVHLQTSGVSLLAPHLTVYDASGQVVGDRVSTSDRGDTLEVVLPAAEPGATYRVMVQAGRGDAFGTGEYALGVNFDALSRVGSAGLDAVARQTYNYLSPDDIDAIFRNPQTALFATDHHTNDTPAGAIFLQPAGAYGTDGPIRTTASLEDPRDVDFYGFETPDAAVPGESVVVTVTVRATEINGIMPRVTVLDPDGGVLPALVLAHGDGTATIQIAGARPGYYYDVAVAADPTSGKVVGNYDLDVEFGHVAAAPVMFVASSLAGPISERSYTLVVTQSQLFDFLLAATGAGPSGQGQAGVDFRITDGHGQVVATRTATAGDTAGGDPVLLTPGVYQASFTAISPGGAGQASTSFYLYGASLSDPIGPALDDPTLRAAAAPATTGDDPFVWLARGLSIPSGPAPEAASPLPGGPASVAAKGDASAAEDSGVGRLVGPGTPAVVGPLGVLSSGTVGRNDATPAAVAARSASPALVSLPRVVVNFALRSASLLAAFTLPGAPTQTPPDEALANLPESTPGDPEPDMAAVSSCSLTATMALPGPAEWESESAPAPAPAIGTSPAAATLDTQPGAAGLRREGEDLAEGRDRSRLGSDPAQGVAALAIAAMIYGCTQARRCRPAWRLPARRRRNSTTAG